MKQSVVMAVVGATVIGSVGAMGLQTAVTNSITLVIDGHAAIVRAVAGTVETLLTDKQITVGPHDYVSPNLDAPLVDGLTVTVAFGRQVDIVQDGRARTVWTTASTVAGVLADLNMYQTITTVSPAPATAVTNEGLTITVAAPKLVTLKADGVSATFDSTLPTVGALLSARGIALDGDDRVSLDLETPLADRMVIAIQRVTATTETAAVEVPYERTRQDSGSLAAGTTKIQTAGVNGFGTQTWHIVFVDGVEESRTLVEEVVTTAPVNEVVLVGTKQAAAQPAAQPVAQPAAAAAPAATGTTTVNPNASGWSSRYFRSTSASLLADIRAANAGNPIIQLVADQVGKPYVGGGTGPNAFDCSGLIYYAYKTVYGRILPRTAGGQGRAGTPVSWDNIQPGDLIWEESHVVIYVGDGLIIHAANPSTGVVIGNAGYYKARGNRVTRL